MEADLPDWWKRWQLRMLKRWPMEPERSSASCCCDEYAQHGEEELAQNVTVCPWRLQKSPAVHLRKSWSSAFNLSEELRFLYP